MLGVGSSPTLSQLLKEAKAEGALRAVAGEEVESGHTPLNYSRLFDEYHGESIEALT